MVLQALDRLIDAARVRRVAIALVISYVAGAALWFALMKGDLDLRGQPLGADFIIFYGTSSLTLKGGAALAYVPTALLKAEAAAVHGSKALYLWCYPPTFQLVIAPLALAPYRAAFAIFNVLGLAAYLAMTRLMSRERIALLVALAFPAVFQNFMQGQNGFLTTAILGGGLLLMDKRPWLAGAILGLLVIKPHLALLLPVLTLGTGRWRTIGGAAVSVIVLTGLSVLAFGLEPWRAFFATLPNVSLALSSGALPLNKTPTLFVMMIQLGAPVLVAQGLQILIAAAAAAATLAAWRRKGPWPLKAGLACLATLIALPYAFDYDLVLLAVPIGAATMRARLQPAPTGVPTSLAVLYAAPLLVSPLWSLLHVQLVPILILLGYGAIWRQLWAEGAPAATTQPLSQAAAA